jgi:hypothetical protein
MGPIRRAALAVFVLVPAVALAQAPSPAAPPPAPPAPKNLQVLPKDMPREQLIAVMRGFSRALGVGCDHCHAPGPKPDGPPDFPADTKWEKGAARTMLRMTMAINGEYLTKLEPRPAGDHDAGQPLVRVECMTCHRGVARPETVQSRMARVLAKDGPEAAIKDYRQLRTDAMTGGGYDFTDAPLNAVAEQLIAEGKAAQALPLLDMDVEYNPKSSGAYALLAEARLAAGNRAGAIEALERAVTLEPRNQRAKKRLDQIRAETAPKP